MSCIPFLYGVGASVAMIRGYWPPPQIPPVACPPPRPQQPPQQPPPNPPPPQIHYYREDYDLFIPPMLAFHMNVHGVVQYPTGDREYTKILPGNASLMLGWRSFPMYDACPEVITTTTNQYIHTDLKSLKDLFSTCRSGVVFPWGDISITYHRYTADWEGNYIMLDIVLYVFQFVFFSQNWFVAVHKIEIPPLPPGPITPEYLRNKLNNRRERLYLFHDSEADGFGTVFTNIDGYGAFVNPSYAVLYHNSQIAYTLQPTSNIAYFMLTVRTQ
jgi:hypothetical protein